MIADICNHTQNKQGSRINKHIQVNKINKKDCFNSNLRMSG